MARRRSCPLLVLQISHISCTPQAPPWTCYCTWLDLSLRFKMEVALNGVAPAELPGHTVLGNVHAVARGLGDVGRRAGNGAEDGVVDGGGLATGIRVGGHLRVDRLTHAQCTFATFDAVLNRH